MLTCRIDNHMHSDNANVDFVSNYEAKTIKTAILNLKMGAFVDFNHSARAFCEIGWILHTPSALESLFMHCLFLKIILLKALNINYVTYSTVF